ncbi:MAG: hypothetical protein HFE36_03610 [Clostridia bacterium]|nr:hypothetical protein [Clostridia bacterium]
MKNTIRKILLAALCFALSVYTFAACGYSDKGYAPPRAERSDLLTFSSSDSGFDNFINDYAHRHLRYDEDSVADINFPGFPLGSGSGFAKNWETMGLVWHNSVGAALGSDKQAAIREFLATITQDGLGMVYNSHNIFLGARSTVGDGISQGWPIPNSRFSGGKSTSFEFNDTQESVMWSASNGVQFKIHDKNDRNSGYASFSYAGQEPLRIYTVKPFAIDAEHAPVVEMELCYDDARHAIGSGTDVADISIIWQTKEGGNEWYNAPQSLYCTSPRKLGYSYAERSYYSMYLHENWNGKTVTAIGIEITPKENATLDIRNGRINYIRPDYDTRQSNPTYQWLLALGNYIAATNDASFLEDMLPKARRATLFLTHALEGESGLLSVDYLYGHDGIGYDMSGGKKTRSAANGIGNGYWDILCTPDKNLEANIYFYQALKVMADLEKRAADAGIESEPPKVKNRAVGEREITYDYTEAKLRELAATVKSSIEKNIRPVLRADGTYGNDGGFYNPLTARFASGVARDSGEILDYGYVMWNEEALAAGIGNATQRKRIMEWINGDRTVAGDDSSGDDIYVYEFGPRTSTKQNSRHYAGFYDGTTEWAHSVQNGGSVMCWSYYDLISRKDYYGADDMFARFKGIQSWYEKVLEAGGSGENFYNDYYLQLRMYNLPEGKFPEEFMLQQTTGTNGSIGLDAEFLESIMLVAAMPYGFFGFDGNTHNTLGFTPCLPSALEFMQIDNMVYGGTFKYSVRMENGSLEILNAQGTIPAGASLRVTLPKTGKVAVNGKAAENAVEHDGKVTVTVPLGNVRVSVR